MIAVVAALALFVLQVNPGLHLDWEAPGLHFYLVSAVAALAFVMAIVLSIGAAAIRQYSVLLLALGFMAMAGLFTVHGLATPGVILPPNSDDYATASVLGPRRSSAWRRHPFSSRSATRASPHCWSAACPSGRPAG